MAKSESSALVKRTSMRGRSIRTPKSKGIDFSKGVVGKYYERAMAARNLVMLDPDLLDAFPDSDSVNAALRSLRDVAQRTAKSHEPKHAA